MLPYIMREIAIILTLTCLILVYHNQPNKGCFELFGFDIMLDSNLKPWLLEVNCAPALSMDSEVDERIKIPLITDTLRLIGIAESLYDVFLK